MQTFAVILANAAVLCVRLGAMKIAFLSLIPSSDICRGRKLFSWVFLFPLFFALRAILSIVQRHTSEKYHRCRFTQAQYYAMHNRGLSVLRSSQLQEEMNFKILNFSLSKGWKTFDEGRKNRQTETSCWQIFRFFFWWHSCKHKSFAMNSGTNYLDSVTCFTHFRTNLANMFELWIRTQSTSLYTAGDFYVSSRKIKAKKTVHNFNSPHKKKETNEITRIFHSRLYQQKNFSSATARREHEFWKIFMYKLLRIMKNDFILRVVRVSSVFSDGFALLPHHPHPERRE